MSNIAELDKNFKVETNIERHGLMMRSIDEECFSLYGVFKENGIYRRMPEKVAVSVSEAVRCLHMQTAGGRIRFVTDSEYIAVSVILNNVSRMPHFALTGSAGVDIYADSRYLCTIRPPYDFEDRYEGVIDLGEKKLREITVNMPIYSGVTAFYIGLNENSKVMKADKYKYENPVVFYGSSITQGGCASRPGMTYEAILSRRLDFDYINLGFSGNAKGEQEMADYIASLDMSAFVYDYDFNAPTEEHLKATHEKLFKTVREKHPELPVIIMSRPKFYLNEHVERMREIIKKTYVNAVNDGDNNVYFIDGSTLMDEKIRDNGTVDGTHPTDLGFFSMAEKIAPVLEEALK